ncbi:MAG: hypothetical protein CR982_10490 [Candidatus Cloacimonadota bacterium]|nr:MAG: hypothetical protein CR982_10490 [Candidatus Cloacimonadota bacterium]PIE79005.1 MAG: hypothetical protein CSA15_04950 [Candidatus Delongbacteria bacterium]
MSTKISLVMVSIILSISTIIGFVTIQKSSELLLGYTNNIVDDIANLFVKMNTLPLSRGDYYSLENHTKKLLNNDNFVLVEIYDASGFKVTNSKRKDSTIKKGNILYSKKDIYDHNNVKIGSLVIGFSMEESSKNINQIRMIFIVFILISIIISTIAIIILVNILINKPLSKLVESVKNISDGDLSNEVKIIANDEIGDLSRDFNLMTRKLRKSQKLISNIIEYMPSIMIVIDRENRITQWNKEAIKFTEISDKDALGKNLWEVVPNLKILKKYSDKIYSSPKHNNIKKRKIVFEGSKKYFSILIFPLFDYDNIEGIVFDITDITDSETKEQQLMQAQKMESIGTLAGGLAHDFNNVLSGIIGTVDIMEYKIGMNLNFTEDQLKRYIGTIKNSGNRAKDMVLQLLSLSKKHDLNFTPIDLNRSVKNVMKICKTTFDKSVSLNPIYLKDELFVKADATQIEQVILNLCINSYHAMTIMREDSSIGGNLEVRLEKDISNDLFLNSHPEIKDIPYCKISVIDTGIGMDEDIKSKIFDPFFTTKDKDKGTGLGMAMVYNIIKEHGGFIDIQSKVGVGSEIYIYLPILVGNSKEVDKNIYDKIEKGSGTILVVDDESTLREQSNTILSECGYDVITAKNGLEGIEKYKENIDSIDLVILDIIMPKLSGDKTYKYLKEINMDVKVILTSGFKQDERITKVLNEGALDFIQKPYTIRTLSKVVAKHLN